MTKKNSNFLNFNKKNKGFNQKKKKYKTQKVKDERISKMFSVLYTTILILLKNTKNCRSDQILFCCCIKWCGNCQFLTFTY